MGREKGEDVVKLTTIFSTGAPGAARGALDAAGELGLAIGGWTAATDLPPALAERLRSTLAPRMAARLNVQDSDGTLILSFDHRLRPGSAEAYADEAVEHQRRSSLHIVLPDDGRSAIPEDVRKGVLAWIAEEKVVTLHVTGPREADEPGIQQAVHDALVWIFEDEVGPRATFAGVDRTAAPESLAGSVIDRVCRETGVTFRNEEHPLVDTIARIAAELPNRPMRPPMTTLEALEHVARTGDDPARRAAQAEIVRIGAERVAAWSPPPVPPDVWAARERLIGTAAPGEPAACEPEVSPPTPGEEFAMLCPGCGGLPTDPPLATACATCGRPGAAPAPRPYGISPALAAVATAARKIDEANAIVTAHTEDGRVIAAPLVTATPGVNGVADLGGERCGICEEDGHSSLDHCTMCGGYYCCHQTGEWQSPSDEG